MLVSSGKVTLAELDSVYSLEDAYDLVEVVVVDAANRAKIEEWRNRQQER